MQSKENLKCILLEDYLFEKINDVKIKSEMLWLYLRIVAMTYEATQKHDVDAVKQSFLDLFKEDIIFFDKKDQVQFIINNGVFDSIFENNVKLSHTTQLKTIEEEQLETLPVPADANDLAIKIQEMVDDTTEHIEDIVDNVNAVVDNIENITETLNSSSFYAKLKTNCNKVQGYLSHCFGGGKTKD